MRQPTPQQAQERKPGRSFEDPEKPLGDGILERSGQSDTTQEDFRAREHQADMPVNGVAERAKAIGVLRKFEELSAENNPPTNDEPMLQRTLALAAGRVGLTIEEYHALVKGDQELLDLETKVLNDARSKFDTREAPKA